MLVPSLALPKQAPLKSCLLAAAASILFFCLPAFATTETILHAFTGTSGPANPLVMDGSGNLYGATQSSGGQFFELSPDRSGGWNYTVLYTLSGNPSQCDIEGCYPTGPLTVDNSGNIYGVNEAGGANYAGTVFKLTKDSGGAWSYSVIYTFGAEFSGDGYRPQSVVYLKGALYGDTMYGGASNFGTVFSLTPNESGDWAETVLHSFENDNMDGIMPLAPLTFDPKGNLYGITTQGGPNSVGTLYELSPNGNAWSYRTLFNFESAGAPGLTSTPLVYSNAKLYGVAGNGGQYQSGVVYELSQSGGSWTQTILYTFAGGKDGTDPDGIALDSKGKIYGTTSEGGGLGVCKQPPDPENWYCGTAFSLTPSSTETWKKTILFRFGNSRGSNPIGLVLDQNDNVYGDTAGGGVTVPTGLVFKLSPSS